MFDNFLPRLTRFAIFVAAILLAIATLLPSKSSATWKNIGQFSGYVTASYFFSVDTGVIGFNSVPNGRILRTTDGGANWTTSSIPVLSNTTPWITDIWFANKDTGWCTIAGQMNISDPRVWRTNDGGISWKAVVSAVFNWPTGVRLTPYALVVTEGGGVGVHYSIDSGKTWALQTFSQYSGGLDFLDTRYGVATNVLHHSGTNSTGYRSGFLYTTTGGTQWQNALIDFEHEAYTVYAMKHSSMFIAVPEDTIPKNGIFPGSHVYRSKPNQYGASWDMLPTILPFQANGCVMGINNGLNNVLFIQNSDKYLPGTYAAGLYRSRDSGMTWVSIGGPNEDLDVHFSPLRCGDVIYAFDDNGSVWKTTDGGDGKVIPECVCLNLDSLKALTANICDTTSNQYWLHNVNVGEIVVEDISIVDSNKRPSKTFAVHIDSLPDQYMVLEPPVGGKPGDSLSFRIGWKPMAMMDSTASDTVLIRIIYYAGYLERANVTPAFDTFYWRVSLHGLSSPAIYTVSTRSILLNNYAGCTVDTLVTITNEGCDSMFAITKATLWQPPGSTWTLLDSLGNPVKTPIHLGIGKSVSFHLHAVPQNGTKLSDSLRITTHYQGRDSSFAVQMSVTGNQGNAYSQMASALAFDSLATCASVDTFITVDNIGCNGTAISITKYDLVTQDWTLLDSNGNALVLPLSIPSGHSVRLKLHFAPKTLGHRYATLTLHYPLHGKDTTNAISLDGVAVASGTMTYPAALDFGSSAICGPLVGHDTTITLHNTSCDSTLVNSLIISGPFTLLDPSQVPVWVHSGKSITLRVHYTPTAKGVQTGHGILTLSENNNPTITYDTLNFSGTGTPGLSTFQTSPPLAPITFATRNTCDNLDSATFTIYNRGCDTMQVTGLVLDAPITSDYDIHASRALPAIVPNGDSLRVTVAIAQLVPGSHNGIAHVRFTYADGSTHDTTFALSDQIDQGSGEATILSATPTLLDFGAVPACESRDTEIVISDSGCGPIQILERSIVGAGFTMAENGIALDSLHPGEKKFLHIHYSGATGTSTATVTVRASGKTSIMTYTVTAASRPVDSVHFLISFSKMPVASDESFSVYLKPDRVETGKGIHSIAGVLVYHSNSFVAPNVITGPPGATPATFIARTVGMNDRITFAFTSASDISLDPNTPVMIAGLQAKVADSVGVGIYVDSITVNGGDPTFPDCVLASNTVGLNSQFTAQCGDSTIIFYLRGAPLVTAERLHPNPITSLDNFRGSLNLLSVEDGAAEIEVTDGIGRTVSRESLQLRHGESSTYTLDLSRQPAGTYFYAIRFASASGRAVKDGMVVLVK